jgi:ATP-dependent Clp protease adaptor protein ClpS
MLKILLTGGTAGRPSQAEPDGGVVIATKSKTKGKRPSLFRVLLVNDDFTPMDFVVMVLRQCFAKTQEEAVAVMLSVHNTGVGVCGVYTFEVAETKVMEVMRLARQYQHPLQCTMERE